MIFVPNYYASAQIKQWNSGAFWIEQPYQPNDGLVCYDNLKGCQVGLKYYFHAHPIQAHFDADSPGSFSAAVAWRNSHYHLIGHMQSGTVNVYLYKTR